MCLRIIIRDLYFIYILLYHEVVFFLVDGRLITHLLFFHSYDITIYLGQ